MVDMGRYLSPKINDGSGQDGTRINIFFVSGERGGGGGFLIYLNYFIINAFLMFDLLI